MFENKKFANTLARCNLLGALSETKVSGGRVHFSLIKWLQYRERGKKGTQRYNLERFMFPSTPTTFHPCSPGLPSPTASFSQAVYPCIPDTTVHLFPETRRARCGRPGGEERREKPSRDPTACTTGGSLKAGNARNLKPRVRAVCLIRSAQAQLGIRSLNNAF